MQYNFVQCSAILCTAVKGSAVQGSAVKGSAVKGSAVQLRLKCIAPCNYWDCYGSETEIIWESIMALRSVV